MLRRLDACDGEIVRGMVALHQRTLPESIFARLGEPFLRYTYERLFRADEAFGWTYLVDGRPVGLITCTIDFDRWASRTLRREWWRIVSTVVAGMIRQPRVVRECLSAAAFLQGSAQRGDRRPAAEIVSFAVEPAFRKHVVDSTPDRPKRTLFYAQTGIAIAEELFRAAVEELARRGARRLRIMTLAHNPASNRFYARYGCAPAGTVHEYLGVPVQLYEAPIDRIVSSLKLVAV